MMVIQRTLWKKLHAVKKFRKNSNLGLVLHKIYLDFILFFFFLYRADHLPKEFNTDISSPGVYLICFLGFLKESL